MVLAQLRDLSACVGSTHSPRMWHRSSSHLRVVLSRSLIPSFPHHASFTPVASRVWYSSGPATVPKADVGSIISHYAQKFRKHAAFLEKLVNPSSIIQFPPPIHTSHTSVTRPDGGPLGDFSNSITSSPIPDSSPPNYSSTLSSSTAHTLSSSTISSPTSTHIPTHPPPSPTTPSVTWNQAFKMVEPDLEKMTTSIIDLLAGKVVPTHPLLVRIASYYFELKGKRLRPAVILLLSHALAPLGSALAATQVQLAGIIEMIHTASLVHDDVLDDATTRRDLPSANAKFGNKLAVMAGDFCWRGLPLILHG
eukprot:Phypoly_transcript_07281.p1 GENE.Phypoly_transcript_07281~~Phypoly_transcript_07281.p1  ORF type:complete len:308 (+),score=57.91 Phypoly_transcript_07281:204-1127(+)